MQQTLLPTSQLSLLHGFEQLRQRQGTYASLGVPTNAARKVHRGRVACCGGAGSRGHRVVGAMHLQTCRSPCAQAHLGASALLERRPGASPLGSQLRRPGRQRRALVRRGGCPGHIARRPSRSALPTRQCVRSLLPDPLPHSLPCRAHSSAGATPSLSSSRRRHSTSTNPSGACRSCAGA